MVAVVACMKRFYTSALMYCTVHYPSFSNWGLVSNWVLGHKINNVRNMHAERIQ